MAKKEEKPERRKKPRPDGSKAVDEKTREELRKKAAQLREILDYGDSSVAEEKPKDWLESIFKD